MFYNKFRILLFTCFFANLLAFQPQTKAELQTAVNLWVSDEASALSQYGDINTWDVSLVTEMNDLFKDKSTFNDDISSSRVWSCGSPVRGSRERVIVLHVDAHVLDKIS